MVLLTSLALSAVHPVLYRTRPVRSGTGNGVDGGSGKGIVVEGPAAW